MKVSEARFVVIDTETTGIDPGVDRVVDVAAVLLSGNSIETVYSQLINPKREIPPEASAVHHIIDRDVWFAPTLDKVWGDLETLTENAVVVAHNAKFDQSFLPGLSHRWLCTYRLARHLWPEAPGHSNQVLRYALGLDVGHPEPHRANGDAWVTAHILRVAIARYLERGYEDSVESLWDYADSPIQVQVMPFGKHKGVPMSDVPRDYLHWALNNMSDMDNDLRWSIEQVMKGDVKVG